MIGFALPVYLLPFDQRQSLQSRMFGWPGALTPAQTSEIAEAKQVIYDGFLAAVAAGAPRDRAAILVDEQFGAAILRDAVRQGFLTACSTEKSGQAEFDFEYGEDFAQHLEAFRPTFGKALVHYNPEGDRELNQRQAERLRRLSEFLHGSGRRFLFELYVDPEPEQLARSGGQKRSYELRFRPDLTVAAIRELQDRGVEPDVWKVEPRDRRGDYLKLVAAARRDGRAQVGCLILGGGQDERQVRSWLATAASVPGFIGFAIGRTTFWDALVAWRAGRFTKAAASQEIARRYLQWIQTFGTARIKSSQPSPGPEVALERWEDEGGRAA